MSKNKTSLLNLITKITLTGLVVTSLFANVNTHAAEPIAVLKSRKESFTVAFKYGNVSNTVAISNIAAQATLQNMINQADAQGFTLVSITDQFNGDPSNNDEKPAAPTDCVTFGAPTYSVAGGLVSGTGMTKYGLQSAKAIAGGQAVSTLGAYKSGCILMELKVSATAKVGDTTKITFTEDANQSSDYTAANRPGNQEVVVKIVEDPTVAVVPTTTTTPVATTTTTTTPVTTTAVVTPKIITPTTVTKAATVTTTARTGGVMDSAIYIALATLSLVLVASTFRSFKKIKIS
jgi:hypothetical protein